MEQLGVLQGLICVNGEQSEVFSTGSSFIEQLRPVIAFLNAGGASHHLAQAIRHHKAQILFNAEKAAREAMEKHKGKRGRGELASTLLFLPCLRLNSGSW
jgi:hypothetical protein